MQPDSDDQAKQGTGEAYRVQDQAVFDINHDNDRKIN
jgi:hypothetical protein